MVVTEKKDNESVRICNLVCNRGGAGAVGQSLAGVFAGGLSGFRIVGLLVRF